MLTTTTAQESIRRVLTSGFAVRDIAEPFCSFGGDERCEIVAEKLSAADFDCGGIRLDGRVKGFVRLDELASAAAQTQCRELMHPFSPGGIVSDSAPLSEVVQGLVENRRMFVSLLGEVGGIVTREDLGKPPIRMWLFGMVSIIEMRIVSLIRDRFPRGGWREIISPGRAKKAEQLMDERKRRGHECEMLDCLQLGDKMDVIARDETLRHTMAFESRRRVEDLSKKLQSLRNHLAHSQDIVRADWEMIVVLTENLDRVIQGPPENQLVAGE